MSSHIVVVIQGVPSSSSTPTPKGGVTTENGVRDRQSPRKFFTSTSETGSEVRKCHRSSQSRSEN